MPISVRRAAAGCVASACLVLLPWNATLATAETVAPTPVATASTAASDASNTAEPSDSVTPFIDNAPDVAPDNSRTLMAFGAAVALALVAAVAVFFRR